MAYTVVFAPQAEDQLAELYVYIATEASPDVSAGEDPLPDDGEVAVLSLVGWRQLS